MDRNIAINPPRGDVMRDYELIRRIVGWKIINHIEEDFPMDKMGVADKFLLNIIGLSVVSEFDELKRPIGHPGFQRAVCTDAKRMYGYRCTSDFYEWE